MGKRIDREYDSAKLLHPAKVARHLSELRLAAADPDEVHADVGSDEMDGVDARDFVYLNRKDMLEAINSVEIDDRFMRIPAAVSKTHERVPYFERPTKALILYRNQATAASGDSDDKTADDLMSDSE